MLSEWKLINQMELSNVGTPMNLWISYLENYGDNKVSDKYAFSLMRTWVYMLQ